MSPEICRDYKLPDEGIRPIKPPEDDGSNTDICVLIHELEHAKNDNCKISPCQDEARAYERSGQCVSGQIAKNCGSSDLQSGYCAYLLMERCFQQALEEFQKCRISGKRCKNCANCEQVYADVLQQCSGEAATDARRISCDYCLDSTDPLCNPTPTPAPTQTPTAAPTETPLPTATSAPTPTARPSATATLTPTPSATATATSTPSPHVINFCAGEGVSCGAGFDAAAHRACACLMAYPDCYVGGTTQLTCFCGNSASDSLTDDIATMTACAASQNGTLPPDFEGKTYQGSRSCVDRILERYSGQVCYY